MRAASRWIGALLGALLLNLLLARGIGLLNRFERAAPERVHAQLEIVRLEEEPSRTRSASVVLRERPEEEPTPRAARPEANARAPRLERPAVALPSFEATTVPAPPLVETVLPALAAASETVELPDATGGDETQTSEPGTTTAQSEPSAPASVDGVDQPPRELPGNPQPAYPALAQRRRIEGEVVLNLTIDARGHVTATSVVRGPKLLVDAVLDVVSEWRFTPARHQGRAVAVRGPKTFRFDLPR